MALTVFRQVANPDTCPLHVIMSVPSKNGKPSLTTRKLSFVGGVYATDDQDEIDYLQEHIARGDCVLEEAAESAEVTAKIDVRPKHTVTRTLPPQN